MTYQQRYTCERRSLTVTIADFGSSDKAYSFANPLKEIRCIAIGPESEFDAVILETAGEKIRVSREHPFIGDIDLPPKVVAIPDIATENQNGDVGSTHKVQLRLYSYIPPFVPSLRSPLRSNYEADISTGITPSKLRVLTRGRDRIFVRVTNRDSTDSLTYVVNAEYYSPENETLEQVDVTPSGMGTLAAGETEVVELNVAVDRVSVTLTPTNTIPVRARIEAYDR